MLYKKNEFMTLYELADRKKCSAVKWIQSVIASKIDVCTRLPGTVIKTHRIQ